MSGVGRDPNDEGGIQEESSLMASMGVGVIQTIVFVYDFITFPLYYCAQQPWKRVEASK